MSINLWQRRLIRLRAMRADDWSALHAFDSEDTELARLGWSVNLPRSPEGSQQWAAREAAAEPQGDDTRLIIETLAGVIVGTVKVHRCDARNGTFEYGIALGRQHWRKGYASEAIRILLSYYFGELRYQKVNVRVYDFNDASLALHEKLGFQREGRLRRTVFSAGAFHDEILLGLTAEEFFS